MNYECSICKNEPNSHSFELIDYNDQTYFFYTCPAKAIKYYDCSGILQHYDGYLNQMTENTKWVWIFDANDFEIKHLLEVNVAIELAKLITNKYSKNLEKICIINPNWYIYSMTSIVWPFLSKKVRDLIIYDSEKYIINV